MLTFVFPENGTCVHKYDGTLQNGGIAIAVKISAEKDAEITINGQSTRFENGTYTADVFLDGYRNTLTAKNTKTGEEKTILFGLTGTGYFDMYAYEKFHDNKMSDYIPTDEELKIYSDRLPKIK